MTREIYLDNSATTALLPSVKEKMTEAMGIYGNPSSLHFIGNAAHDLLEEARMNIAKSFGLRKKPEPGEIILTSCGSEADKLALFGTATAKERRRGMRIITTDSEHPAIERNAEALRTMGFDVVKIPTRGGVLDFDAYEAALTDRVMLVSLMMVNNETGAYYDVGKAFAMAKAKNPDIVTHTDAVQGYLKCKFTPAQIHADLVSVSAHKIHGPKGVGALYVSPEARKRRDITPVLLGGGQEAGFRSGTENIIGIAGFGEAARVGYEHLDADIAKMRGLRERAIKQLTELPVILNLPKGNTAPHILNLTLPGLRSETVLHELSRQGICISNGSACSSHSNHPSTALTAFGLDPDSIGSSIRVSLSAQNTEEDIDALTGAIREALERLVKIRR